MLTLETGKVKHDVKKLLFGQVHASYRGVPSMEASRVSSKVAAALMTEGLRITYSGNCFMTTTHLGSPFMAPSSYASEVSVMSQTNAFSGLIKGYIHDYDIMYAKRSFVHWYVGCGLSEGFFGQACESVRSMAADFEEVFIATCTEDDEDDEESME